MVSTAVRRLLCRVGWHRWGRPAPIPGNVWITRPVQSCQWCGGIRLVPNGRL